MAKTIGLTDMRRFFLSLVLAALALPAFADEYAGRWVVNVEETQAVAVPFKKGGGLGQSNWRPNISIMGLPLPGTQKMPPMSGLKAKDPDVLRCAAMTMTPEAAGKMKVDYTGLGKETLREGHYRGRDTSFGRKGIKQSYKTPERKVTKTWTIREDGRLLVEVKIKPVNDRSRTFRRVFDRAPPEAESATES